MPHSPRAGLPDPLRITLGPSSAVAVPAVARFHLLRHARLRTGRLFESQTYRIRLLLKRGLLQCPDQVAAARAMQAD